ncbi:MAG: rhomboid family intramembrane serine protease [Acidobacteria bacterium]|nr:rhomboid family intramembrane serine protease [Acidobacteriota bacterium]
MFLPIGDTPNPRNFFPWVNWSLIAANILIYLVISLPLSFQSVDPRDPLLLEYLRTIAPSLPAGVPLRAVLAHLSAYDLFVFSYGYKPAAPQISDLFFAMFLHGGFLHLAGNMLFLWIYGDNVEHRLGRLGYLVTYLGTGVVATLAFAMFAGDSMIPMVGASGAISGVLGLYFLLFPRNQVKVFVFLFPFILDVFLLPARLVLGFYLIVDNLLPVFLSRGDSPVAYGAHIGGFIAGLVVAWIGERAGWQLTGRDPFWRRKKHPDRPVAPETGDVAVDNFLPDIRRALADDEPETALEILGQLDRRQLAALSPAECVDLARRLIHSGHAAAAVRLLRICLAHHSRSPALAPVYLMLGLIRLEQGQPTAAYQYLLEALDHDPDDETAALARQAMERINVYRRRR